MYLRKEKKFNILKNEQNTVLFVTEYLCNAVHNNKLYDRTHTGLGNDSERQKNSLSCNKAIKTIKGGSKQDEK